VYTITYQGEYEEFTIPETGLNQITFYLKGGEGGRSSQGAYSGKGGGGATVRASFGVGPSTYQLKPGGRIRFIVGGKGQSGSGGGGGGGGTAVLYSASDASMTDDMMVCGDLFPFLPEEEPCDYIPSIAMEMAETSWVILAVAGGGGGAVAHWSAGAHAGGDGKKGECGGDSREDEFSDTGQTSDGGCNGNGAPDWIAFGGNGGGAISDGFDFSNGGGKKGGFTGGEGGLGPGSRNGGFGYGGGGGGMRSGYICGGGGGGYGGGSGGVNEKHGAGGGSFANSSAVFSEKKDGNRDNSPDHGKIAYRFEQNDELVEEPVALCKDVTVLVSGDQEQVRGEDADDGSYDPGGQPLTYTIRAAGDDIWVPAYGFDCNDIGDTYTFTLRVDNGIHDNRCDFTVEIEQGPPTPLICPPSITVQPQDCLPIIGENILYYYEGDAYFPEFEPQSFPACNTQIEYYIIRPDGSIDITQDFPINDQLYRDTFDFGISTVVYTATYENEDAAVATQSCAFTISVDPEYLAPRCPDNGFVTLDLTECGAEVSGLLPEYECGELAYRITGPELENPTITEGTGELNSFSFLSGTSTVEWYLVGIPEEDANCSFTIYVEEESFADRPTFINCPNTASPYIYEGITPEAILEQIDFAVTDDCNVVSYELTGRNGGSPILRCDDIGNNKRMEIWAYDTRGYTVCEFTVVPQSIEGLICPEQVVVEINPNNCGQQVYISSLQLAPVGAACGQFYAYDIYDSDNQIIYTGSNNIPDLQLGRGTYLADYSWISGSVQHCYFNIQVIEAEAPTAVCQNPTVYLSDIPEDLAAQVGAGSSDNCSSELTYSLDLDPDLDCADAGRNVAQLTVTDESGNASKCVTVITVVDDLPPVITACPENRTVAMDPDNCSGTVPDLTGEITGTFPCDSYTILQIPEAGTSFGTTHSDTLEVKVGLLGENGFSATCEVLVILEDVEAPVARCDAMNIDIDNAPPDLAEQIGIQSTDNCGIESYSLDQTVFDCSDLGLNTLTLIVTDTAGNTSSCLAEVTLMYTPGEAQFTISCPEPITTNIDAGSCTAVVDFAAAIYDQCGNQVPDAIITYSQEPGSAFEIGTTEVSITAGNLSCTTTVTVNDNIAPTAVCRAATVRLTESGDGYLLPMEIGEGSADACGPVTLQLDQSVFTCTDIGFHEVMLTVTDAGGKQSACSATVEVVDVEPITTECLESYTINLGENGQATLLPTDLIVFAADNCTPTQELTYKLVYEVGNNEFESFNSLDFDCTDLGLHLVGAYVLDEYANFSIPCEVNVTVTDPDGYCPECEPTLNLTGTIAGGSYQAADWIESDGTVQEGTTVSFLAGNSVRLLPGFKAEAGSTFRASIAACEPAANRAAASTNEAVEIAIGHRDKPGKLQLYPNPFRDRFTLLYELEEETEVEIWLISVDGRIKQQLLRPQFQSSGTNQLEWNSPDLPAGIYFIQLRRGNMWSSQKLVKMK
jgi:hypothetical protein